MALGGAVLKISATVLRAVQFLCALAVLGIFAYFLVYLQQHSLPVLTFVRAVTGIAGFAALYTLIAFFLTCCLGGITGFAFAGILLDLAFGAAFIAVAVLTKDGNTNCSNIRGGASSNLYSDPGRTVDVNTDTAQRICTMYHAAFVLAIILLILFIVTAALNFGMGRAHQRDKRRGVPSKGPKFPFFKRRNHGRDMETGAVPVSDGFSHGHGYGHGHNHGHGVNHTAYGNAAY